MRLLYSSAFDFLHLNNITDTKNEEKPPKPNITALQSNVKHSIHYKTITRMHYSDEINVQ